MAEDINIKIQVDTSQAQQSTESYKKKLQELQDEMVELNLATDGMSKASAEQKKRFDELQKEIGGIKDAIGDAASAANNYADDYRNMTAALQGIQGAIGGITAVSGAMNMLGVDSEGAAEAVKNITSLMGVLQGVQAVQKTFNKDSAFMSVLMEQKNKLLTKSIVTQTAAQKALNLAKLGAIGAITGLVAAIGTLIYKYASAKNAAADLTKEINKQAVDAVAPMIEKVNRLKEGYEALAGDLDAQKKYYEAHKEEIKSINSELDTQEKFENVLIKNTQLFVEAQLNRAKAEVARTMATDKIKEKLQDQLDYERRFVKDQRTFWEEVALKPLEWLAGSEKVAESAKEAFAENQKNIDTEISAINDMAKAFDDLTKEQFKALGLSGEFPPPNQLTALEAMNQALERTNLLLKIKHTDAINSAKTASEKLIATKKLQYESLTAEIEALTKLNEKLDNNSAQYLKNELRIKELTQQRQELYKVEEITAEEEDALEAERMESANKYLDAQIVAIKERNAQKKAEEEEWQKFLDEQAEKERKRVEQLEAEKEKIREQKWQSAQDIVNAYNNLVTTAMEAELEAVGDNEEEQKRVRKKYAKAQFIGQIASIGVSTAKAIMETWSAYAEIPFVGTALAAAQSAVIAALGVAQAVNAKQQMNTALKAEKGGILQGKSHAQGGIMLSNGVEAEGGEAIINKRSTAQFAPILSQINAFNGYGAPFISSAPISGEKSAIGVSENTIRQIVSETIAGVTSIPVVVSEHAITETQRSVNITKQRALI